jgi:hypothetical protein
LSRRSSLVARRSSAVSAVGVRHRARLVTLYETLRWPQWKGAGHRPRPARHVLPGVPIVPAMVIAIDRAQEAGIKYNRQ